MISIEQVLAIHEIIIEEFGGATGVRDKAGLESAINRPFQTFDGQELYPNPVDMAAAVFESIISNHPFVDGNKRTSYVLMRLFLQHWGQDISAPENEKYKFVIRSASGQLSMDDIKSWITNNLKQ